MKHLSLFAVSLLVILSGYSLMAQQIGIGEWRDHLPYHRTVSVAPAGDRVYCATPFSLFYYIKSDNSINRLTRVNGLNDQGVAEIGFNRDYNTLLVAYSNTNIDLVKGNTIINMPDIMNSAAITPDERSINSIRFVENKAYLSCGFGIVVIDLVREEVIETYYIGPGGDRISVHDLTFTETDIYAATETGIFVADRNDPNLAFYDAWSQDETLPDPDAVYNHIEYNQGTIFTNKYSEDWGTDTIFYKQNGTWLSEVDLFGTNDVLDLYVHDGILYVAFATFIRAFDESLTEILAIYNYYVNEVPYGVRPVQLGMDNYGLWIADQNYGLVWRQGYQWFTLIHPNGPISSDVYDIDIHDDVIWAVQGGRDLSWNNLWKTSAISYMVNGQWSAITSGSEGAASLYYVHDYITVAINPRNKSQVFAGSWDLGLVEYDNYKYDTIYNPENSTLQYRIAQGEPICKIGGLAFDDQGRLWMSNSGVSNILSVRIEDGTELGEWKSFNMGNQGSGEIVTGPVIIDSWDQKWIMLQKSLIVFSDGGTLNSPGDDKVKWLSQSVGNGNLPGTKIYSLVEDLDGEIWVGTDEGPGVIYSPENVFTNQNFDAQQILIPRNDGTGLADILLESETVTAIAVDGANNKWIGTERSGAYLISPDGLSEIHHFTMENSPLLSNNITSIAINHTDGEVFFGTAAGIISYKGSATGGGKTNSDVLVYPNPVRPDYTGPIAVRGLVSNASFKITDINGALIYSGRAEGGQAVWDGNNFSGRRAQSGVYLVFVTDDTGEETMVSKILFLN